MQALDKPNGLRARVEFRFDIKKPGNPWLAMHISLFNWATIVFSLCLLVVIGWSGWNAVAGWNAKETEAATAGAKDDEGSTDR